jgi:hypothetical protein
VGVAVDKAGGITLWDVFGGARTLDLGLPKPIIGGTAPSPPMPKGGASIGAARTPDGLESGGRESPDVGMAREVVDVEPAGVGGGGDGATRPLGGGLGADRIFDGGRVGAARPLGCVGGG